MGWQRVQAERREMKHFAKKYENIERYVIEDATILDKNFEITVRCPSSAIKSISFRHCKMYQYPSSETLLNRVSNLTYLAFYQCGLTSISRENLRGLKSLTTLNFARNSIERLPKGLFDYTPKLEIIALSRNEIKWIDEDILDSLNNLKYVNLGENVTINAKYDSFNGGNVTLPQLKELIKKKCKSPEEIAKIVKREKDLREREALAKKHFDEANDMKKLEQEFEFNEIVCEILSPKNEIKHIKFDTCQAASPEKEVEEIKMDVSEAGSPEKEAGIEEIKMDVHDVEKGSKYIAFLKEKMTPTFKIKPAYVCYSALCLGCLFVIARKASK